MKKLFDKKKTKEKDEKGFETVGKMNLKAIKSPTSDTIRQEALQAPRELFWDDYSDVGYC